MLLYFFANIILMYLHLCSLETLSCNFLCVLTLSGIGIRVLLALENDLESIPCSSFFWKYLRRGDFTSFQNVGYNSPVNLFSPGLLFWGGGGGSYYCCLNLPTSDWSIYMFCFFMIQSLKVDLSCLSSYTCVILDLHLQTC